MKKIDAKIILSYYAKHKKQVWAYAAGFVVLFILKGCFFGAHKPAVHPRPVTTAIAGAKDVPVYLEAFGNLNAPNNVDIKSQVTGQIQSVNFVEGQEVKKGDLLFTIDARPFQAELAKAEASLIQSTADYKMKKDTLERNRGLLAGNLISQQDFDQYETNAATAEAKVKLDRATVDLAKINLDYCMIIAPFEGRTGKRQVDPGNIVQGNTGAVLVNIKTVDDLYVDFSVPETELSKIREANDKEKLVVEVNAEGDPRNPYKGQLQFLDNAVDTTTGTVFLRALLLNQERRLWPGQFVRLKLILGTQKSATLVPYEAVSLGQKGPYLFTLTTANTAELRQVVTGPRQENDIVVTEGVHSGERVVVTGQMGLAPGVPVLDATETGKNKSKESSKKKFFFF